jgi:putative ABC transport system permease protein
MNLARWLGWLIPASEREFVLGDLEEAFGQGSRSRHAWELVRAAAVIRMSKPLTAYRSPLTRHRGDPLVTTLLADLRYGLRQLARRPGFTALAVLTLALGIGASTAIVSVVYPVLFRPLPYPDAGRIVSVWENGQSSEESNTGFTTFLDVQRMATSFEGIAAVSSWQPVLQGGSEPERLEGQRVTRSFFSILGVSPALGRDFTDDENVRGKHLVAILSHGLWQRRFGGYPGIVGRPINLNGTEYTVVGVLPGSFESLHSPSAQIWAPLGYETSLAWACRTCRHLRQIGRLKPGISPESADRELDLISARIVSEHPTDYARSGMTVVPFQAQLTREVRPALLAVLGAVGLVLLIACANVSALLLGRALEREGEFAIRGALGAGRHRVVRQLLTESVLLSLIGGTAGVALAWWGVKGLTALGPASLPRLQTIGIDGRVLAFTALLSVGTGLVFGLVPALAMMRPNLFAALRPSGRLTGHKSRRMARAAMVAGEIALALMLLVGAGLLMQSLKRLLRVDPGFDAKGILTLEVQTAGPRYQDDAAVRAFFERAALAVRALPGVTNAAWTSLLPLGGNFDQYGVQIEGKDLPNRADAPSADRYAVTPGYLETMRIPLRRGRTIEVTDAAGAPPVVLINETLAKLGWPGEDPLGKRVQLGGPDRPWFTIVGITGDVRHVSLDEPQAPQVYLPESQWFGADDPMVLVARTRGDPELAVASVRAAIRALDPDPPILRIATMEQILSGTAQQRRFAFVLFQVFAGVALLLAAAGIYGVLAGSVTERTREMGIRTALGAPRLGLLAMVVRQGLGLTLAGAAAGILGALVLSRFLGGLLYGVGAKDPVTIAGVVALLLVVALAACWAPAWRATRVSPLEALKAE